MKFKITKLSKDDYRIKDMRTGVVDAEVFTTFDEAKTALMCFAPGLIPEDDNAKLYQAFQIRGDMDE